MTTKINSAINEAKNIINALMESDMVFYDRTEGNELSGRFNVQMTFAESICYRPQYTVRKLRNLVLTDTVRCQFVPELHWQQCYLSVNLIHMRMLLFRYCLQVTKNLSQYTNSSRRTG